MTEPERRLENWCRRLIEAYVGDLAARPDDKYAAKGIGDGKVALQNQASKRVMPESEDLTPSRELVRLIDDVQPSAAAGETGADSLVPATLPREVKTNIYSVTREQFATMYNLETALARVEERAISHQELVGLYLKSFRNILHYELSDLHNHRQYFDRIMSYCTHIFQDLMEALYPGEKTANIVSAPMCVS